MSKKIVGFLVAILLFTPSISEAAVWVDGYTRSNGTYVSGYYRSEPNGLKYDNYSWSSGDELYNDSYYDTGRDSNWYTPSYTWDSDYYYGYNYNSNALGSDYNNYYAEDYYSSSYYDYSYPSYSWY